MIEWFQRNMKLSYRISKKWCQSNSKQKHTSVSFISFLNCYFFRSVFFDQFFTETTHTCFETAARNWCHNRLHTVNNINTETNDNDDHHGQCGPKERLLEWDRVGERARDFWRLVKECVCVSECVWVGEKENEGEGGVMEKSKKSECECVWPCECVWVREYVALFRASLSSSQRGFVALSSYQQQQHQEQQHVCYYFV